MGASGVSFGNLWLATLPSNSLVTISPARPVSMARAPASSDGPSGAIAGSSQRNMRPNFAV